MPSFHDVLMDQLRDGSRDQSLPLVPLVEYLFASAPVRLCPINGGVLRTIDGRDWFSTLDEDGVDHHTIEPIPDGRDGTAEQFDFTFPFLDEATHVALRSSRESVSKRPINIYLCWVLPGEGLNPQTPVKFFKRLTMQSAPFGDHVEETLLGTMLRNLSLTIRAKDNNAGQSFAARRTYTDAGQQAFAAELGVAPDNAMGFVNTIRNLTIKRP